MVLRIYKEKQVTFTKELVVNTFHCGREYRINEGTRAICARDIINNLIYINNGYNTEYLFTTCLHISDVICFFGH